MRKIALFLASFVLLMVITTPLSVSALFGPSSLSTSFGGRIISVLPCEEGFFFVTIIPAGVFPISYVWTPGTITKLAGPPRTPGQQILGLADTPITCTVFGFLTLVAQRMQMVGTSPI